jgi:hypothetical protein
MSDDFDWLDEPAAPTEAETLELGWLFDDPQNPPPGSIVAKRQKDPRFRDLAARTRALPYRQRLYLKCLAATGFSVTKAVRMLSEKMGVKLDASYANKLLKYTELAKVVEIYQDLALEAAGLNSPARTLLRIDAVVEDALTPVPRVSGGEVITHDGQVLMEVDRGSALKGLELIGKAQGAFRKDEETQQRVTVVLDFSGEKPAADPEDTVLEGEFDEVKKD